jgi:hypothetical protein
MAFGAVIFEYIFANVHPRCPEKANQEPGSIIGPITLRRSFGQSAERKLFETHTLVLLFLMGHGLMGHGTRSRQ